MTDHKLNPLQRVLRLFAEIVVAVYVVVDSIVFALFRPVVRWLSGLRVVQRLERWIQSLPPYVILVVMVVPFIIAELAKVFAVYWMAEGHFRTGMTIFIGAYIISIFVCERILHAGKAQLLTIPWFAWCYNWVMALRDAVFGWFKQTAIWRAAVTVKDKVRVVMRRMSDRVRALFGYRPKPPKPRLTPTAEHR